MMTGGFPHRSHETAGFPWNCNALVREGGRLDWRSDVDSVADSYWLLLRNNLIGKCTSVFLNGMKSPPYSSNTGGKSQGARGEGSVRVYRTFQTTVFSTKHKNIV